MKLSPIEQQFTFISKSAQKYTKLSEWEQTFITKQNLKNYTISKFLFRRHFFHVQPFHFFNEREDVVGDQLRLLVGGKVAAALPVVVRYDVLECAVQK